MKTPHDTPAEEVLISCLFLDGNLLHNAIQAGITPEHFHDVKCRLVFTACLDLHSREMAIESIGVINYLKANGQLKQCGMAEVSRFDGLADTTSPYATAKEVVLTKAGQRKALTKAREVVEQLEGEFACREDIALAVNNNIARINNALKSADRVRTIDAIVDEAEARADRRISGRIGKTAISFGIDAFDRIASPIESHELVIIAARPSLGKSSLSRQIAFSAIKAGHRTAMFVLETSDVSVLEGMASEASKVSVRGIHGAVPEEQRAYTRELGCLREMRKLLRIYDRDLSLAAIDARCRTLKAAWQPDLVIIDYLQLIRYTARGRSRADEIGDITKRCVELVKHLGCPVVLMSQLTRGVERENRMPVLSDLRDSGSIESDASRVIFIHRMNRNAQGQEQMSDNESVYYCQLIQAKLRDGKKVHLNVNFQSDWATFEEI